MKLLHRNRESRADGYYAERSLPDEAQTPEPEHADPAAARLSGRDYPAVVVRASKNSWTTT
jgi:hypothetical protein